MQLTEMDVVTDSNNSVAIMVCISWLADTIASGVGVYTNRLGWSASCYIGFGGDEVCRLLRNDLHSDSRSCTPWKVV